MVTGTRSALNKLPHEDAQMKSCLVVDDSDVIRKVASHILNEMNLDARGAESGPQALEQCSLKMPDAILVDWHMPDMSGIDFITALSDIDAPMPYVIYCTTENDPEDITHAINAGANDFMLKPLDREGMKLKLREAGFV